MIRDWKLDKLTNTQINKSPNTPNKRITESTKEQMNESTRFRTFEDLECWQTCRELRIFAAKVCHGLPKEEGYRLKDQILRSARSTTANLAEGYGRFHYQENI